MINKLKKELENLKNKKQAEILQRFFKTGKGEYGEGDIFLGIKVPVQRKVAKKYNNLSLKDIENLLNTKIHEFRLTALFILIGRYKKADEDEKKKIYELYFRNTNNINNWDLIDLTAPNIIGDYLLNKDREILFRLANSNSVWEKRISILATFAFINNREFKDTFKVAEILLKDEHDLIHKGVGWMLREVGKRISQEEEEEFLRKHYKDMPRTMLRYAIERFSDDKKRFYMKK